MSANQPGRNGDFDRRRVLNDLLALEEFSLANYLLYAPPWLCPGEEPLLELVRQIAADQQDQARRIGEFLYDRHEAIEPAQFPAEFAVYNDVELDYILVRLIEEERLLVDEVGRCLEQIADDAEARRLAEEALASEKRHVEELSRLAATAIGICRHPSTRPDEQVASIGSITNPEQGDQA